MPTNNCHSAEPSGCLNMNYTEVASSMINLVGYNEEDKILEVRFVNSGYTYAYFDVPKKTAEKLLKADSKGSFMLNHIIGYYDCSRVKLKRTLIKKTK